MRYRITPTRTPTDGKIARRAGAANHRSEEKALNAVQIRIHVALSIIFAVVPLSCSKNSSVGPTCDAGPLCRDDTFASLGFGAIDSQAAWSPDGHALAYYHAGGAQVGDTNGLYLVTPEGASNWVLTPGLCENPDWSPDGQCLVFSCGGVLYQIRADGEGLTDILSPPCRSWNPRWSPDGRLVACACNTGDQKGIWIVPSDSQEQSGPWRIISPGQYPAWSHSGLRIAFLGYLDEGTGICVMDSSGANATLIFEGGDNARYPAFSPDDGRIAFSYAEPGHVPQVWVMNSDGSDPRQLTTCGGLYPAWSPDGRFIAYTDTRRCNGRLWIMNADGSCKRQVTQAEWWPLWDE
jgi:Tol biopolymer transport system component